MNASAERNPVAQGGPVLETRALTRLYQMGDSEVAALGGVSIAVYAREFLSIQGTSGSGKSTLLNMLGGLDRPSSGEVLFMGQSLGPFSKKQMARYRRDSVGMIFQNFNLIPTMTAAENVGLALAFAGVRAGARAARTELLLARVGLASRMKHRPAELSGGEQQRVSIARALANKPRVLLADEPTGNLDSARAEELLGLLRVMVAEEDLSVVMVTHDAQLAARYADRAILMKDGLVVK